MMCRRLCFSRLEVWCFYKITLLFSKKAFVVPAAVPAQSKQINCEHLHLLPSKDKVILKPPLCLSADDAHMRR